MKKATIVMFNFEDLQEADRQLLNMACKITDALFHTLVLRKNDDAMIGVMEVCTALTIAHHGVQSAIQAVPRVHAAPAVPLDGDGLRRGDLYSDISPELYRWVLRSFEELDTIPAEIMAAFADMGIDDYKRIIATAKNVCTVCAGCRQVDESHGQT